MKTIAIILTIVAFAAARKLRASSIITRGTTSTVGIVDFIQNSRSDPVRIRGVLTELKRGKYYGSVHVNDNTTNFCKYLGPIAANSDGTLRHIFAVTVPADESQSWRMVSDRFTLIPDEPNSIINCAVAIHDSAEIDGGLSDPNDPSMACGPISSGNTMFFMGKK